MRNGAWQSETQKWCAQKMLTAANPRLGALANVKFTVIGPSESLTDNSMEFDPEKLKVMVAEGEADASAVVG